MKIEYEVSGQTLVTLSRWASVQRTLNLVMDMLETPEDMRDYDDYIQAVEELRAIGPVLDALHQSAQSQMWRKMCGIVVKKMHGYTNDYVCRLEKNHRGPCKGW